MVLTFVVKKLKLQLVLKCSLGVQIGNTSVCCWIWFGGFFSLSPILHISFHHL
jgi:hypothetical protein